MVKLIIYILINKYMVKFLAGSRAPLSHEGHSNETPGLKFWPTPTMSTWEWMYSTILFLYSVCDIERKWLEATPILSSQHFPHNVLLIR